MDKDAISNEYGKFDQEALEEMLNELKPDPNERRVVMFTGSANTVKMFHDAVKNEANKWLEIAKDEMRKNAKPRTGITWGNQNR